MTDCIPLLPSVYLASNPGTPALESQLIITVPDFCHFRGSWISHFNSLSHGFLAYPLGIMVHVLILKYIISTQVHIVCSEHCCRHPRRMERYSPAFLRTVWQNSKSNNFYLFFLPRRIFSTKRNGFLTTTCWIFYLVDG